MGIKFKKVSKCCICGDKLVEPYFNSIGDKYYCRQHYWEELEKVENAKIEENVNKFKKVIKNV